MISDSPRNAAYARAGWTSVPISTTFPGVHKGEGLSPTVPSSSTATVWVTGRYLHSMCQLTLSGPHTLQPHLELKAAVEKALAEKDARKRTEKMQRVWERYGQVYVESVEMGAMYHATAMVEAPRQVCLLRVAIIHMYPF